MQTKVSFKGLDGTHVNRALAFDKYITRRNCTCTFLAVVGYIVNIVIIKRMVPVCITLVLQTKRVKWCDYFTSCISLSITQFNIKLLLTNLATTIVYITQVW